MKTDVLLADVAHELKRSQAKHQKARAEMEKSSEGIGVITNIEDIHLHVGIRHGLAHECRASEYGGEAGKN